MISTGSTLVLIMEDVDPDEVEGDDTGRFIKMDVHFKDHDKKVDMKMETSQGVQEFKDYPLKFNWGKRLRNLKFTRTMKTLMDMQIISKYTKNYYIYILKHIVIIIFFFCKKNYLFENFLGPCVATTESVRTNDNVTYAYNADTQWTLVSGHCAQTPSYGVFTKKTGNKFDIHLLR